jgi:hypothetical protein
MKPLDSVLAGGHPRAPSTTAATTGSATDVAVAMPTSKVKDWHLQRKAIVYIRQSTPQQVLEHRESADRQYSLVHRAALLGWPQDRIEVVWVFNTCSRKSAWTMPASSLVWR